MAKPIAYFSYTKDAKVLSFKDLSLNSPTLWEWDFGDGNNSVSQNPTHTYTNNGFYVVTLIATNADGDSDPLTLQIGVGESSDTINRSLLEYVDMFIPPLVITEVTNQDKMDLIHKWQIYLQPLVYIPYKVSELNTHNEFAWPGLVNTLIAQLVAYDLTIILAQRAMTSLITGVSTGTGGVNEGVKKITTGPTEVEFQDSSDDVINTSKALQSMMDPTSGLMSESRRNLCMLASRLMIKLPICPALPKDVIAPIVGQKYSYQYAYGAYGRFSLGIPNTYLPILDNDIIKRIGMFKNIGLQYSENEAAETRVSSDGPNYFYYGFRYDLNPDDFWRIIRVPRTDLEDRQVSESDDNTGVLFDDAWTNRDLLSYD